MAEHAAHPHTLQGANPVAAAGSTVEALGGGAAVVLTILGLAGVLPMLFAAIATIAIGVALWFEGGALAARYSRVLAATHAESAGVGGGTSAEFLGGGAGTVLGILALLNVAPMVLVPVALIVFGAAVLLGSTGTSRVEAAASALIPDSALEQVSREAVGASAGAQVLTGLAAIVLGILALVGIAPTILPLVGLLSIGAATLLSGAAVGGRMLSVLHD